MTNPHPLNPTEQMILAGAKIMLKDILDDGIKVPDEMWIEAKECAEMTWKAMWKQSTREYNESRKTTW